MSDRREFEGIDLDDYRWKNRLVLIFAPSDEDVFYLQQVKDLEDKGEELTGRDIMMIELIEAGNSRAGEMPLSYEQQLSLRRRFEIPADDFAFILIGKDGTVKLRSDQPVMSSDLFDLIDSMPMRKEEMKRKAKQR